MSTDFPPRMDTRTAAAFLGLSPRTLEKRRVTCSADPPFLKIGRKVLYDKERLSRWLASKARMSTSDPGPATSAKRQAR